MSSEITLECLEVGSNGRPLAYDEHGNKVEITLDDDGQAVAFDADGNKVGILECQQECGVFYAEIIHRNDKDIGEAIERLIDLVWYNRCFLSMEEGIKAGREAVDPQIWKQACSAARELEEKHGEEFLIPESDFEWGMINGKLSALRWVCGDEWDFLDT